MNINELSDNDKIKYLQDFEEEIADLYRQGKIKYPIHLRNGYEKELIEIFNNYYKQGDYIFNYWASHLHCLLAGVPKDLLIEKILKGYSISLILPEYNIYCSGIVGSLCGTAVGTAFALKRQNKNNFVHHFCGEMGACTGIFREAVEYAYNYSLPIKFYVEDNGISVTTNTQKTWNYKELWFKNTKFENIITHYIYKNSYPHSGIGSKINF